MLASLTWLKVIFILGPEPVLFLSVCIVRGTGGSEFSYVDMLVFSRMNPGGFQLKLMARRGGHKKLYIY